MPIEVRHGEDAGALAALAMLAGMQQQKVPELPRFSVGRGGGGGGGGGGRAPAQRKTTYRPPKRPEMTLEEELRTRAEYDLKQEYWGQQLEEERMRLENEMAAEGWELKLDVEGRKTIQEGNSALGRINRMLTNGEVSEEEASAMQTMVKRRMVGVEKTLTPPDPNKPKFKPGEEPGVLRVHEGTGAIVQTKVGTNGQPETSLVLRPDQTFEYLEKKTQADERKVTLDLQRTQDEKEEASREKYTTVRNAFKAKMFEKLSEAENDPNVALQKAEITTERLYPQLGSSRKQERQRSEFDRALESKLEKRAQLEAADRYGVRFTEEESNAPANVREAILFARAADKQYGDRTPPPDVQAELSKAIRTMREYDAEKEEEARMMQEALQDAGPNPGLRGFGVEADLEYLEN